MSKCKVCEAELLPGRIHITAQSDCAKHLQSQLVGRTLERDIALADVRELRAQVAALATEKAQALLELTNLGLEYRKAQTAEANADAYAASLKRTLAEVCEALEVDASRNVYLYPDDLTEDTWNRMNEIGCPAINAALEMKGK
jgi:hypothetical protein